MPLHSPCMGMPRRPDQVVIQDMQWETPFEGTSQLLCLTFVLPDCFDSSTVLHAAKCRFIKSAWVKGRSVLVFRDVHSRWRRRPVAISDECRNLVREYCSPQQNWQEYCRNVRVSQSGKRDVKVKSKSSRDRTSWRWSPAR